MTVCLSSCSLTPIADLYQTVRTCPAQLLAHLHPKTQPEEFSRVVYLKRSMREPRKLRKLLCRLMWLSSSSLILPKTYRREKKGLIIQARAQQPGNRLHVHAGSWAHTPVLQGLVLPQVHHPQHGQFPKQPLCAIPHEKAAQCTAKELALCSRW